jgi:hypothetical protein
LSTFKGYKVTAPDGKSYEVTAPEGTSEEELYSYVEETYYPTTAVAGKVNKSAPINIDNEQTLVTRTLEEVPGAWDFLNEAFFSGENYNNVVEMFAEKSAKGQPFEGVSLPADGAKIWAQNKQFATTPEGRRYFETNSPIAPVNRATGVADEETPDSVLEEFGNSAMRSGANMANSAIGLAAQGADMVGADDLAEGMLDDYLYNQAAIQQTYKTSAPKFVDVKSFGEAAMKAAAILGELTPQLASSVGFGLIGSKAGQQIAMRTVEQSVKDLVENGIEKEIAEQMVLKTVQAKAAKGAIAGTTVSSVGQSSGAIYGDTYGATGERKPWTALLAGTAAGSLDAILPAIVVKKLGIAGDIVDTTIVQSLTKKIGKDAASAFLLEGGTEALQTIIEQLPAGKSINWDDVVEAALSGAFGGSAIGGASGAYEGSAQNTIANKVNPPKSFEGDPISVPTTKGKKTGKTYLTQIDKTQNEVIARVDQLTQNWENKPAFEVYKSFENEPSIPNDTVGVYRDGKVYLNTEAIVSEAKQRGVTPDDIVSSVTFHEALGHYGLAQKFGEELDGTLANILANSTLYQKRVEQWMAKNPDAYRGRANRDILALEEILAERSEGGRMPASIVNVFKNKIKEFGRQMGLNLQYSTREVETILGMAHAAVVKGPARDVRDNGYRTMYAGANAAKPPKTWLGMPDESRWFTGPDGKPRFEFSDAEAFLDLSGLSKMGSGTAYLPQVLEHKELFEQYPSLRNTRIRVKDTGEYNKGSYNQSTNLITVNENLSTKEKLSTILHEIQHNIQKIEGFARGGNPDMAVDAMPDAQVLNAGKNLLTYNENKLQEMRLKVGAIVSARNMPEGKRLIEDADIRQEILTELEALEKKLQENSPTKRLSREDLLRNFEYRKLDEELTGFLPEFNASRKALRGALFPREYLKASKEDRKEWGELAYNLEKGSDHIGNMEYELYLAEEKQKSLRHDLAYDRANMVRIHLRRDEHIPFQAYESLLGEVEARDTEARQYMTMDERLATPAYTSQNEKVPADNYIIDGVEKDVVKDDEETEQLREAYRLSLIKLEEAEEALSKAVREFRAVLAEAQAANRTVDGSRLASPDGVVVTKHPSFIREKEATAAVLAARDVMYKAKDALDDKIGKASEMMSQENPNNRYMRMTSPDKVKYTQAEIDEMTPEELFDSENALNILEGMTKGYTPVVMSYDDLKQEAETRGLSPSKVLRNNGIGAGELVKRLYMYDIAMTKMNDRLSTLWEKIETGKFTMDDKAAYVRGVLKRDELAGRIFEDQSEVARALAALKGIQYTRRRVQGMQETLLQFKDNTPYAALNDPEVFYKFASQIQGQIEDSKTKVKEAGKEFIGNALNLPRALMSSMDLSAPLRQGIFLIHKAAWWKAFFQMFRYAGDQKAYDDLMESITSRDTYGEMIKSKLALSNLGSKLSQREEDFMSEWAEKIPVVGRFVRGSERAYVGFLNKLRADVFDQLYSKLPPEATEQDLKDIAGFINAASGRGNMTESLNKAAPVLNALFFSPRLMVSRFKMTTALIDPRTYITMNKTARNEYIKSILTVGGLALLINTLAAAGGAETEEDPRSSDFGKLKFGNTRYDILGGEGQYITLMSRLLMNSYKTTDGQVKPYGIKFGQTNQLDAIGKFFTNKAAPIPSFIMDYFRGVDAVGKKFEMDKAIVSRFFPMYMADIQENIAEEGLPKGVAMSAPGLFGIGTQTYKPASTDTEEPLEAPDDFKLADAVDGEYLFATVKEGNVTLKPEAKKEWASRINFYYKEWMTDEMKASTWKTLPDKEKAAIIKEVRADARKEAKADMLDLLAIEESEE